MKKVTFTDVALRAGVSVAAVSRYVNNSGYVSQEKQQAIKKAIDEVGYSFVKEKKKKDSNLIGVICPLPRFSIYYQKLSSALMDAARKEGKQALLFCADEEITNRNLPTFVRDAAGFPLDGLVVCSFRELEISPENVSLLSRLPFPVVLFERTGGCRSFNSITFDDLSATMDATQYLLSLGHREIAYIGCSLRSEVEAGRYHGYCKALEEEGIPVVQDWVVLKEGYGIQQGRTAMQKLIRNGCPATAVVAGSDSYAMGALQAFQENGLRVPEDISIIGLDDSYAEISLPAMSTMAFPMDDAARAAVEMIREGGKDAAASLRHITFGLKMILRNSTQERN